MKLNLKACQMEQITVTYLEQMHHDLKCELQVHDVDPYLELDDLADVIRSVIAIEIVMKELMFEDAYYQWKLENGVEL